MLAGDALFRKLCFRPKMTPLLDSCATELALHDALLATPRRRVSVQKLAALQNPTAREKYGVMLAFRDRLRAVPTPEIAYLDINKAREIGETVTTVCYPAMTGLIFWPAGVRVAAEFMDTCPATGGFQQREGALASRSTFPRFADC